MQSYYLPHPPQQLIQSQIITIHNLNINYFPVLQLKGSLNNLGLKNQKCFTEKKTRVKVNYTYPSPDSTI